MNSDLGLGKCLKCKVVLSVSANAVWVLACIGKKSAASMRMFFGIIFVIVAFALLYFISNPLRRPFSWFRQCAASPDFDL